jgi:hypothetical protein
MWTDELTAELDHKRFRPKNVSRVIPGLDDTSHLSPWVQSWIESGGQAVRIHDSGDFFADHYLEGWIHLAYEFPNILFYAYTKEVAMLEDAKDHLPPNFLICYSMGGRQDHLIDRDTMRHADVFPDLESIEEAGYMSQHESDLLCVLLPTTRIGIPQNNIPHFKKALEGRTFSEVQESRTRKTPQ